jgi:acetyl esterase/lipase
MSILMIITTALITLAVVVILITKLHLRGQNLSNYNTPAPVTFDTPEPSDAIQKMNDFLSNEFTFGEGLSAKRKRFNTNGSSRDYDCEFQEDVAVYNGLNVPGEWTIPKGADTSKRMLYLHGGGFTVGSPISHRPITTNIAKRTGCVVFAPDYRLMPENPRIASIHDSRTSYLWLLENGPEGKNTTTKIAVGGDSAGGNLTLSLCNWLRDQKHRLPDAVIAISPSTDSTVSSPSIRGNYETDIMLKPLIGPMLKIPNGLLLWLMWKANKIAPSSTLISPVHDSLHDLPPTLVHASTAEMLFDDAVRYVNKAKAHGSPVEFQSWAHMCHVWHIFDEKLPEAHHALDEIAAFMHKNGFAEA